MSTQQISSQAEANREQNRSPDGKFGTQPASEAHVQLGDPANAGPAEDGSAPGAVSLKRLFPFRAGRPHFRLGRISVGGQEYVTDRYSAIRNDHVKSPEASGADNHLGVVTFGAVPHEETVPVDPESRWTAPTVGPLVKAGFEVRANPDPANTQEKATHHVFNSDGEHIGWVIGNRRLSSGVTKGVRFAQIQETADSVKAGAPYSTWEAAHARFETEVHD